MILVGYIKIVVGIAFSIMAAPIAVMLIIVIIPFAAVAGAVREIKELLIEYPKCAISMMQRGFKIADTGLKRIRATQTKGE